LGYGGTVKTVGFNVFFGGGTGAYYLYNNEDSFGIVNIGLKLSKGIRITEKYSLPIYGSLIFNPHAQRVFVVFGISF